MAKNFNEIRTDKAEVLGKLEKGQSAKGRQTTASPKEKAEREAAGKTQGRKGCKATRINLAFNSDNYEFVRKFAAIRGENMTQFVNYVLEEYRKEHAEELKETAKAYIEAL